MIEHPDLVVTTPRLVVRPWLRADLDVYRAWPQFTDPLFASFAYPQRSATEANLFWAFTNSNPNHQQWTILHDATIIGTLTLSRIDQKLRRGWLGIMLGAPFVDQGFGREALTGWLDAYFQRWSFTGLYLEVACWNQRARRLYDALGFRELRQFMRFAGPAREWTFLDTPPYADLRSCFRWGNAEVYAVWSEMILSNWQPQPSAEERV